MKLISDKPLPGGGRRVTLDVAGDEDVHATAGDGFYRLGHPLDDVVTGHILNSVTRVYWCVAQQKWVEA